MMCNLVESKFDFEKISASSSHVASDSVSSTDPGDTIKAGASRKGNGLSTAAHMLLGNRLSVRA